MRFTKYVTLLSALGFAFSTAVAQPPETGAADEPGSRDSASSPRDSAAGQTGATPGTTSSPGTTSQPGSSTQSGSSAQPGSTASQGAAAGGQSELEELAQRQPGELEGRAVRGSDGEEIGEIEQVVRKRDSGDIHAVVARGGVLGVGEERSAVPIDQLEMEQDEIVMRQQGAAGNQWEQDSYDEQEYEEIQAQ